jgi:hypothetical protein
LGTGKSVQEHLVRDDEESVPKSRSRGTNTVLVKVTFGNATLIGASTEWAYFLSAQTRKLGEDGARIGISIFHAMIVTRE